MRPPRHPGRVAGHARQSGGAPGQKHYYRRVFSFSAWDDFIRLHAIGDVLQVCCGGSRVGGVRVDRDPGAPAATVHADMLALPFRDDAFATVACDPIYTIDYPSRVHLQRELARVARERLIFKAPWIPRTPKFALAETVLLASHTCANVAVLSVLQRRADNGEFAPAPDGEG